MAELNVQPKKKSPWWLWLLIALIALALIFFFLNKSDDDAVDSETYEPETGSLHVPSPASFALNRATQDLQLPEVA